jgi:hypothetical protein
MKRPLQTTSSARPDPSLTARSAGREARWDCRGSAAGIGRAPRRSSRPPAPCPRPAARLHLVDQGRHRLAPDVGLDLAVIASSATISARRSSEREIEEDAGAARGPQLAARPGTARPPGGGPAGSWSAGVSAMRSGIQARRSGRSGRRSPASRTGASMHQQPGSAPRSSRGEAERPVDPGCGTNAPAAGHEQHRQHRIMEADVVIGVGAGATMVTISPSLGPLGLRHRLGDERMVLLAERASPSSRRAAAAERAAAAAEAAAAAAAAKPPPPPPLPPQPPRRAAAPAPAPDEVARPPRRRPRAAPRRRAAARASADDEQEDHDPPEDEREDRAPPPPLPPLACGSVPAAAARRLLLGLLGRRLQLLDDRVGAGD